MGGKWTPTVMQKSRTCENLEMTTGFSDKEAADDPGTSARSHMAGYQAVLKGGQRARHPSQHLGWRAGQTHHVTGCFR